MVIMYRQRHRHPWIRAFTSRLLWILLEFEERFKIFTTFKTLFTFFLALLLAPIALFLYVCLKTIRATGRSLFHRIFPNLRLVSSDSLRSTLDTWRNPSIVTLMVILRGRIGLEELRAKISAEIVEKKKKNERSGVIEPMFPHLKMLLRTKLRCRAWEKDEHFDINKHVTMANVRWKNRPINEQNLQNVINEHCCRPLPKTMSPWQVLLINLQSTDFKLDSVCVFIRLHHMVSEGMTPRQIFQPVLAASGAKLPRVESLPSFHTIPETYSVFAKESATKRTIRQIMDKTQSTFHSVRSKCDPNEPREDLNSAWLSARKVLQGVQRFFGELQKLYEMTDPQCIGRSAWARAGSLIYFLPRLLGSFDWLWTISLFQLWTLSLKICLRLPLALIILANFTARFSVSCMRWVVIEVQLFLRSSRPIYILLKNAFREIVETLQTMVLAPSIILNEFSQRSSQYPLPRHQGSGRRVVAWSESLPMETLREVKEVSGSTMNEVLVSLCARAVAQYFRSLGKEVPENMMTSIPVYSKDFFEAGETGGDGLVTLSLPTGDNDAMDCLKTTRSRMQKIRNSPSKYLVSTVVLRYLRNFLPDTLISIIITFLSRQYLLILANISINAGDTPMTAWGREVKSVCYWRPPQANTALSFSLIMYNNHVMMSVMSNQEIVPQPHTLAENFVKEFNGLARMLGVKRKRKST